MMTVYDHDMVAQIIKENQLLKNQLAQANLYKIHETEGDSQNIYHSCKTASSNPDNTPLYSGILSVTNSNKQEHKQNSDNRSRDSDIFSYSIEVSCGLVAHLPESIQFGTKHKPCVIFSVRHRGAKEISWKFVKSYTQLLLFDESIKKVLAPLVKSNSVRLNSLPPKGMFLYPIPWKVDVRNDMINAYFTILLDILSMKSLRDSADIQKKIKALIIEFWSHDILDSSRLENIGTDNIGENPSFIRSKMQGCLITRSEIDLEWYCVFCFINGIHLNIIEEVNGKAQCRAVSLKNAHVRSIVVFFDATEDDARYLFEVCEINGRKHYFTAESEKIRQKWVQCISKRIDSVSKSEIVSSPPFNKVRDYLPLYGTNGSFRLKNQGQLKISESIPVVPEMSHHFKDPSLSSIKSSGSSGLSRYSLYEEMNNEKGSLQSQGGVFDGDEFYMQISKPDFSIPQNHHGSMFGINPVNCNYMLAILKNMDVPSVVARCVQCIAQPEYLIEKGIFRISGSLKLIHSLQEKFDKLGDCNLVSAQVDVHTAADLLKRYLRSLPGSYFGNWSEARAKYVLELDEFTRHEYLKSQVKTLEKMNQNILFTVLVLLREVVQHQDQNNMSAQNLGLALSPALGMPAPVVQLLISHEIRPGLIFQ